MKNKLLIIAIGFALITQIIVAQIPSNIPTNGLIGYWPFNGNANDESGNGNNGKVFGAVLATDRFGNDNKSYFFSGKDWIEINSLSQINNSKELSISIWVKSTGVNSSPSYGDGGSQYYFSRGDFGNNGFVMSTIQGSSPHFSGTIHSPSMFDNPRIIGIEVNSPVKFNIPHTQWHHLLMIYNGVSVNYYVDGVLSVSSKYDKNIGVSNSPSVFGKQFYLNDECYVVGMIDDAAIWNRSLTEIEIKNIFLDKSLDLTSLALVNNDDKLNILSNQVSNKNPKTPLSTNLNKIITNSGCMIYTHLKDIISITWSGTCKDSLANGIGTIVYNFNNGTSTKFEGEVLNGFCNGQGTCIWSDGAQYEGHWVNNIIEGSGTYTWKSGDTYEGEFSNGKSNGQGTYTWKNGDVYVGKWKDGKSNGSGKLTYTNGAIYDGEWLEDIKNGQGTMIYPNGDKYVGELRNNKKNGIGTQTYSNGSIYEGEWKDNIFNGKGTMTYNNGEKYVGQFRDSKKNGQGTQIYLNGNKYVGDWKDDIRDGKGTFFWVDGARFDGEWQDNFRNGFGTKNYSNGDVYEGYWKDDSRNGVGTYTWSDGDKFEGDWKDDRRNGFGTLTYSDGRKYAGGWENDKKNGFGTSSSPNGSKAEGLWVDDTQVGRWIATSQNGEKYSFEWKNGEIVSGSEKKLNNGKEDVKKIWDDALNNMKGGLNGDWIKNPKKCQNCYGKGVVPVCKICEKRGKVICKTCYGKKILNNGTVCIKCLGTGIQTCNSCKGKIYNIKCKHTIWQFQR